MNVLRIAETCPQPVKQEAIDRGWRVELVTVEGKSTCVSVLNSGDYDQDDDVEDESKKRSAKSKKNGGFTLNWRNTRFTKSEFKGARVGQRLNHFPHTKTITKKDLLVRCLRKMSAVHGKIYNFVPTSFILPTEYTKFVKQYAQDEEDGCSSVWICKPSDLSRGRKIFLIRNLSELHYDQQYVIQKYVPNPLTIGGYKFDLRVFVLVTSIHPLRVHIYRDGLARFGTEKYDANLDNIDNLYSHLTNSSINKFSDTYGDNKDVIGSGAKWDFNKLKEWLNNVHGDNRNNNDDNEEKEEQQTNNKQDEFSKYDVLWVRICDIILLTILTVLQPANTDPTASCFELFGFDILVDKSLKPWLLEVNCAPALSIDCEQDAKVKGPLISDMFDLIQNENVCTDVMSVIKNLRSKSKRNKPAGMMKKKESSKVNKEEELSFSFQDMEMERNGNFERIFPFDKVTEEAALRIFADSVKKPAASSQDFTANVRAIVNQIKKRRKEFIKNSSK